MTAMTRGANARRHEPRSPDTALEQDERYTRPEDDALCRQLAGVRRWTLDVAACKESHLAPRYYDVRLNGLLMPWDSPAVWCNPPFSDLWAWVRRAWEQMAEGECELVALLMPATRTEQPNWHELVEPWRDGEARKLPSGRVWLRSHFLPSRTRFGHPGNPRGYGVGSPPFTCVLLVWSRRPQTSARRLA